MFVRSIKLKNYRNHKSLEIKGLSHTNLIVGPNASGKSNVAEALLRFNTFNKNKNQSICLGNNTATVQIEVVRAQTTAKHLLVAEKHQEGVRVTKKQPLGVLPIVYFTPQENDLFGGSPQDRRRFLDGSCSMFKKKYSKGLLDYQKVVKQKNDLLKTHRPINKDLLTTLNQQLTEKAEKIIIERLWFLKEAEPVLEELYCRLTGSPKRALPNYLSRTDVGRIKESLFFQLEQKKELEHLRGCSLVGPHRDDFSLEVNGINVAELGSQGEKRTGCLALKIALIKLLQQKGVKPLLVLDDALSELDDRRRQLLLETTKECGQVFITATDTDNLELDSNTKKFELEPPR